METLLLVSLLYAGIFTLVCITVCMILAYVVYQMKNFRSTTY